MIQIALNGPEKMKFLYFEVCLTYTDKHQYNLFKLSVQAFSLSDNEKTS